MDDNTFFQNFKVFQSPVFDPIHLTEDTDGEAWFIGSELCQVLGIAETNDVYNILDPDEKKIVTLTGSQAAEEKKYLLVSEPGMYRLVLSSRSDQAKAFRKWLVKGIIPAISADGGCICPSPGEIQQNA